MFKSYLLKSIGGFEGPTVAKQLLYWIVVSAFVMTLTVSSVQLYFEFQAGMEKIEEDIAEIEKTILPSIIRSLWLMDQEQINVGMNALLVHENINHVKIMSNDGQAFEMGEVQAQDVAMRHFPLSYRKQTKRWDLGDLYLMLNLKPIYVRLWDEAFKILFNNFMLVATIVLTVISITRYVITKPLNQLAQHASKLRFREQQEVIDLPEYNRSNEIGQIYKAYSQLQRNLTEDYKIRVDAESALKESQRKLTKLIHSRTKQLDEATKDLVESSRKAGMAEVATGVLHNIGNVLTGVNISIQNIEQYHKKPFTHRLPDLINMFEEKGEALPEFLSEESRRKHVIEYMKALVEDIESHRKESLKIAMSLNHNIQHVMQLVSQQQANAKHTGMVVNFSLTDAVEDVLSLKAHDIEKYEVQVDFDATLNVSITSDRHKILQIITNLISNSIQAMDPAKGKNYIKIMVREASGLAHLVVVDNGIGISTENIQKIFRFGFTTKPTGNGFGLHSSAIDANALGGKLSVISDGPGEGATFTLTIPKVYQRSSNSYPKEVGQKEIYSILNPLKILHFRV